MVDFIIKVLLGALIFIVLIGLMNWLRLISVIMGILEGFFKSLFSYFEGAKFSIGNGYSERGRKKFSDPAKEKYFFYKQYEDFKNTWISSSGVNKGKILMMKKKMQEKGEVNFRKLIAFQISLYVFGNIFKLIYSFIHLLVITIISIPIYIFYCIVKTVHKLRRVRRKISNVCPNCYEKFELPYYVCVKCGRVHKNLFPSHYGILRRKCVCGEAIPCSFLKETNKVKAICPSCSREVEVKENVPICISVIGPKEMGKTPFIFSATNALLNNISEEKQWNVKALKESFIDNDNIDNEGKVYNISINSKKFFSEKLLYMFDVSGEYFNNKDSIKRQKYYRYVDGLVFIIDNSFKEAEEYNLNMCEVNDLLDRIIFTLREIRQIKLDELIDIPIAVVINNIDGNTHELLEEVEGERIKRKFQYNFSDYKFFSGKFLKSYENGVEDNTQYVSETVKWILSEASRELN